MPMAAHTPMSGHCSTRGNERRLAISSAMRMNAKAPRHVHPTVASLRWSGQRWFEWLTPAG